ncbi:hypothetical protein [Undibacterium sp.]|uniref:hypothetical protein n=1 Tax=Undibacterium sp. TaxID=1914977 RepID=UPI0037515721
MHNIKLNPLTRETIPVLQRLLQFYYYEASFWSSEQILSNGLFDGCTEESLLTYVDAEDARASLIYVCDHLAGFVLLEEIDIDNQRVWEIADFAILPKHRGGWVAIDVIRQIIENGKHPWLAATFKADKTAQRFFTAVAKRIKLSSVRQIGQDDGTSEFLTYIINENDS